MVVAAKAIAAGARIEAAALAVEQWPGRPAQARASAEGLVGRYARLDIAAGQPVTDALLSRELAAYLQPGERAVTIPVDELAGVQNRVQPGDKVDLFYVVERGAEVSGTQTRLLQGARAGTGLRRALGGRRPPGRGQGRQGRRRGRRGAQRGAGRASGARQRAAAGLALGQAADGPARRATRPCPIRRCSRRARATQQTPLGLTPAQQASAREPVSQAYAGEILLHPQLARTRPAAAAAQATLCRAVRRRTQRRDPARRRVAEPCIIDHADAPHAALLRSGLHDFCSPRHPARHVRGLGHPLPGGGRARPRRRANARRPQAPLEIQVAVNGQQPLPVAAAPARVAVADPQVADVRVPEAGRAGRPVSCCLAARPASPRCASGQQARPSRSCGRCGWPPACRPRCGAARRALENSRWTRRASMPSSRAWRPRPRRIAARWRPRRPPSAKKAVVVDLSATASPSSRADHLVEPHRLQRRRARPTISAAAVYFVYGFGAALGQVAPWTVDAELYSRNATSAALIAIALGAGIPPTKFKGIDVGTNQAMISSVGQSLNPEAALGFVSTEVADLNRNTVHTLAYQAHDQSLRLLARLRPRPRSTSATSATVTTTCGARTTSTSRSTATARSTNPETRRLIGFFTGAEPLPDGLPLLDIIIDNGTIPQCAMQVWRDEEIGPLYSFQPDAPCGCYFESRAAGGTDCQAVRRRRRLLRRRPGLPPRVLRGDLTLATCPSRHTRSFQEPHAHRLPHRPRPARSPLGFLGACSNEQVEPPGDDTDDPATSATPTEHPHRHRARHHDHRGPDRHLNLRGYHHRRPARPHHRHHRRPCRVRDAGGLLELHAHHRTSSTSTRAPTRPVSPSPTRRTASRCSKTTGRCRRCRDRAAPSPPPARGSARCSSPSRRPPAPPRRRSRSRSRTTTRPRRRACPNGHPPPPKSTTPTTTPPKSMTSTSTPSRRLRPRRPRRSTAVAASHRPTPRPSRPTSTQHRSMNRPSSRNPSPRAARPGDRLHCASSSRPCRPASQAVEDERRRRRSEQSQKAEQRHTRSCASATSAAPRSRRPHVGFGPGAGVSQWGVRLSGYIQSQYQWSQLSEDQIQQGGATLNQNRFMVRRGRLRVSGDWQLGRLRLRARRQHHPRPVRRRAPGQRQLRLAQPRRRPAALLDGHRRPHRGPVRPRAAPRPARDDVHGALARLARVLPRPRRRRRARPRRRRGVPLRPRDHERHPARRPRRRPQHHRPDPRPRLHRPLRLRRPPRQARPQRRRQSLLYGTGFHRGSEATKNKLEWSDLNENGAIDTGELVGSTRPGRHPVRSTSAAGPSAPTSRSACARRPAGRRSSPRARSPATSTATSSSPTRWSSAPTCASSTATSRSSRSCSAGPWSARATIITTPTPTCSTAAAASSCPRPPPSTRSRRSPAPCCRRRGSRRARPPGVPVRRSRSTRSAATAAACRPTSRTTSSSSACRGSFQRCAARPAVALLIVACTGEVEQQIGLFEPIRVPDGELLDDEPPARTKLARRSPRSTPSSGILTVGQKRDRLLSGRTTEDAHAIAVRFDGLGSGWWVRPVQDKNPMYSRASATSSCADDIGGGAPPGVHTLFVVRDRRGRPARPRASSSRCASATTACPTTSTPATPRIPPPALVITLEWDQDVDLDLVVETPGGKKIAHATPTSGGRSRPRCPRGVVDDPSTGRLRARQQRRLRDRRPQQRIGGVPGAARARHLSRFTPICSTPAARPAPCSRPRCTAASRTTTAPSPSSRTRAPAGRSSTSRPPAAARPRST